MNQVLLLELNKLIVKWENEVVEFKRGKYGFPSSDFCEYVSVLGRVQKRLPISEEAARHLRRDRLIEGRRLNIHVAAKVAAVTANKIEHIRTCAQGDEHYAKLVNDYLAKFKKAKRTEIDKLLSDKLSDVLIIEQKQRKIGNLLTKLRRQGRIRNVGSRGQSIWNFAE